MPGYYLETSALVKLYVREQGTERMLELARGSHSRMAILALSRIELHFAVRRRQRSGEISSSVANHILELFRQHVPTRFSVQTVDDGVLDIAAGLIERHALRAFDAVQLAGFFQFKEANLAAPCMFVCSDQQLLEAARREGESTLDPSSVA